MRVPTELSGIQTNTDGWKRLKAPLEYGTLIGTAMTFSLTKRPRSPYYFVCFRTAHPDKPGEFRQHMKSTRATSKKAARAAAPAIIEAAQREAAADDESAKEIYGILRQAADIATAGKLNPAVGAQLLSQIVEISTGETITASTIREAMEAFLTERENKIAESTLSSYRQAVESFLAWLGDAAERPLSSLSRDTLREWQKAQGEAVSNRTANKRFKVIRSALKLATFDHKIPANPAEGIAPLKIEEEESATFTPEQIAAILDTAPDDWRGMTLLGYFAGMSIGDALNLRWRDVDLLKGRLSYKRQKTGVLVEMPIHADLEAWLMERAGDDSPGGLVFPILHKRYDKVRGSASRRFRFVMDAAKISNPLLKTKGANGRRALRFHSLRHSLASNMANEGIGEDVRMRLTGHESRQVHRGYTHHEWTTLERAIASVPSVTAKED